MKLGVLADQERLSDSPDTVVVVEPTVGSRARSKGQLYLLVTSMIPGPRARDATRLVAEVIRHEYYYDESAGIRVCLIKAILAANKRLTHARERSALSGTGGARDGAGASAGLRAAGSAPIGVAIVVVRDHELYVATVGPAEAYLSRGARLSTLPDPHRDRGLPTVDLEPDVWRGEIGVGDQLVLVSPNIMARLGPDELKDALVTLHPQPAIEHLHQRFAEAGGTGSDGALVLEVAELAAVKSGRTLVAVKPPEPLAGAPDRSPIPLADTVSGGVAAAQAGARRARLAAGGALGRLIGRAQDAMPARAPAARRITPMGARRESQQRAAVAVLVLVAVAASLGVGVSLLGGRESPAKVVASAEVSQQALEQARKNLDRVFGPGINLVGNDPKTAEQLLADTLVQLDRAGAAGISPATIAPLRTRTVAGLDELYGMVEVTPIDMFTFPGDAAVDLAGLVRGPDGAPYVLDAGTATVYRIDLAERTAVAIYRDGKEAAGSTEAVPHLMTAGGPDLLILDAKNLLWRWRPADASGKGTTTKVKVTGAAEWGDDLLAVGTFLRDPRAGLYNFYVVDPSEQEILAYAPAADGSGFPAAPSKRLTTPRPVDGITSLYIDGDIWITDFGTIQRVVSGTTQGWQAATLPDSTLRAAPSFSAVTSGSDRRAGRLYGYDPSNARLIAFFKSSGVYLEQYRLAAGSKLWADARGWYVEPGIADAPDVMVWITATGLHRAVLEPATSAPGAPGSPGASGSPDAASPSTGATTVP
jgi:serine/threonine protein phosphatase PrpC